MSVDDDDSLIPLPTPLRDGSPPVPKAGARHGSLPSLSEPDLYATAAAGSAAASASLGHAAAGRSAVREFLNDHVTGTPGTPSVPSVALPENFDGEGSAETLSVLSLAELKDDLTSKPKQCHPPEVAASRTVARGRYARSKASWASKQRSTPEGYKREEHAWRFESPFPQGMNPARMWNDAFPAPVVIRPPKKKKSPEERKAIREKRKEQSERDSVHHVETALHKYNRANNTTFGGPCYHYNFTAKPKHHSTDGCSKLFFSEINYSVWSEDDVLLCCIVGEKDKGHCHACEDYRPMMIHPSSRAYGGGNTTCIDYPDEESSSSDSDY